MTKEITIDGVKYIPADSVKNVPAKPVKGMKYVIVRTYSAGVFAGYLKIREGKEVELLSARRIWYWTGAASLSQLAVDGTNNPKECKCPCEVDSIELTEAIEIIPCTKTAQDSINSIPVWKA